MGAWPTGLREALQEPPPSQLLVLRDGPDEHMSITHVIDRLEASSLDVIDAKPAFDRWVGWARWELEVDVRFHDGIQHLRVWLVPRPDAMIAALDIDPRWHRLPSSDLELAKRSEWALGVGTQLGTQPLRSFHRQLKVSASLTAEPAVVLDVDALAPRSSTWIREVAASNVPPDPTSMFSLHMVSDDDPSNAWLHTHGLLRCGSIDLDILEVPIDDARCLSELLNAVAGMFIERGVPDPEEPFLAGQDLSLVWLPLETGLRRVRPGVGGGLEQRDFEEHGGARGLLFAPRKGFLGRTRYESPAVYAPALADNPILYVTNMETERMALLAVERLERFRRLHARFGADEAWAFLVKLGYEVDGDGGREHLWFRVHAFEGDRFDATLLNQPYSVAALHEGDRGLHGLDRMSDWMILCERGRFGPNDVAELERHVQSS